MPPAPRISDVLGTAFAILAHDQAAAFFRVMRELDGLNMRLQVDGESLAVRCAGDRLSIVDPAPEQPFCAAALTSRRTIVDLCDGNVRLLDAVLAGRLDVRARDDRLLRMSRAVTAFSEGAVRTRRMRALLDDFRARIPAG